MIDKLKSCLNWDSMNSSKHSTRQFVRYLNAGQVVLLVLFVILAYRSIAVSNQLSSLQGELLTIKFQLKETEASNRNYEQDIRNLHKERNNLSNDRASIQNSIASNKKAIDDHQSNSESKEKQLKDINNKLTHQNQLNLDYTQLVISTEEFKKLERDVVALRHSRDSIKAQLAKNNPSPLSNINSQIISSQQEIEQLKEWLKYMGHIEFDLLYRMSSSSKSYTDFHNKCDKYHHTISLMKLEFGSIIGAYLSVPWLGEGYKRDPYAFLFNLTKRRMYSVKYDAKAFYTEQFSFIEFGEGDLKVFMNKVISNFPMSYGNNNHRDFELTDGYRVEGLIEFEVFHLYFY